MNLYPSLDQEVTAGSDRVRKHVIKPDFRSGDGIGTSLLVTQPFIVNVQCSCALESALVLFSL